MLSISGFNGFGNSLFLHLEGSWGLKQELGHFLLSEKWFLPRPRMHRPFPAIFRVRLINEALRAGLGRTETTRSGLPAAGVIGGTGLIRPRV